MNDPLFWLILAAFMFLLFIVVVATNEDNESENSLGVEVTATTTTTVAPWPGADTLAQDEAAITFAAALHDHRQIEWAAAAEAARVIEAQQAEQARQAEAARQRQAAQRPQSAPSSSPPAASSGGGGCGALPGYISQRESGCNYDAVNPTGCGGRGCYGAYQFDPVTWNNVAPTIGITSPAGAATPAEQDAVAAALWNGGAGCSHWAACG